MARRGLPVEWRGILSRCLCPNRKKNQSESQASCSASPRRRFVTLYSGALHPSALVRCIFKHESWESPERFGCGNAAYCHTVLLPASPSYRQHDNRELSSSSRRGLCIRCLQVLAGADGRRLRLAPCSLLRSKEEDFRSLPRGRRHGHHSEIHTGVSPGWDILPKVLDWWRATSAREASPANGESLESPASLGQKTAHERKPCSLSSESRPCKGDRHTAPSDGPQDLQGFPAAQSTPDSAASRCPQRCQVAPSCSPSVEDNPHTGALGGPPVASDRHESFLLPSTPTSPEGKDLGCAQELLSWSSSRACVGGDSLPAPSAPGALSSASTSTTPSLSFGWPSPLSDDGSGDALSESYSGGGGPSVASPCASVRPGSSAPLTFSATEEWRLDSDEQDQKAIQGRDEHIHNTSAPSCEGLRCIEEDAVASRGTSAISDTVPTGTGKPGGSSALADHSPSSCGEEKGTSGPDRSPVFAARTDTPLEAPEWSTAGAVRILGRSDASSRVTGNTELRLPWGCYSRDDWEVFWASEEDMRLRRSSDLLQTAEGHLEGGGAGQSNCAGAWGSFCCSWPESAGQEIWMWRAVIDHLVFPAFPRCAFSGACPLSLFSRCSSSVGPPTEVARCSMCPPRDESGWESTGSAFSAPSEFPSSPPSARLLPFLARHPSEDALPQRSPLHLFLSPCRFAALSKPALETRPKCLLALLPARSPTACCFYDRCWLRRSLAHSCRRSSARCDSSQADMEMREYSGNPPPWFLVRPVRGGCFPSFFPFPKTCAGERAREGNSQEKRYSTQHSSVALLSEGGLALPLVSSLKPTSSHSPVGGFIGLWS